MPDRPDDPRERRRSAARDDAPRQRADDAQRQPKPPPAQRAPAAERRAQQVAAARDTGRAPAPAGLAWAMRPSAPWALAGTVAIVALAWMLSDVLLLAFAGMLLALALLQASEALRRHVPRLSPRMALLAVVLIVVLVLVGGSWFAGARAAEQLQSLGQTLPRAWEAVQQWLAQFTPGRWLLDVWAEATPGPQDWQRIAGLATNTLNATVGAIGSLVLVIAIGLYSAADPGTYRRGLVRLVPPARRPLAEAAIEAATSDLQRWLLGQGVSMLAVAVLTGIGLMLIGMPLALPLAMVAGVLDFVPYFGPFVSGLLIVAVALTEGEQMAMYAALVCLAVQQAEAYLVQPLAQRWAVSLPPVLGMLAVLLFGVLFGIAGVLLAVPLMVLTMTLVNVLYVEGVLEAGGNGSDGAPRPSS
jgi:predicted PurR-regulated permease PerM